jgi:hypothetical protein
MVFFKHALELLRSGAIRRKAHFDNSERTLGSKTKCRDEHGEKEKGVVKGIQSQI